MFDPYDEERTLAQTLVTAVAAALGQPPSLDGLQALPSMVVVVNADADERQIWTEKARSIIGPAVHVRFVERPLGPTVKGYSMIAARGCGTLDFQHFECGCRAAQIPGEDEWQLIPGTYCRFADDAHHPGRWPIDRIVRPSKK